MLNNSGTLAGAGSEGDGSSGSFIWGAKLVKGRLDPFENMQVDRSSLFLMNIILRNLLLIKRKILLNYNSIRIK